MRIGDNDAKHPLSFMAKMTLRLFMRTARIVASIDGGSCKASPTAPLAAESRVSVKEEPRTIKLSQVLDQSSDDTAPVLSPEAVKAFYVAYKLIFKRLPPPAKECTVDQLSAVLFRLKSGVPPYADFSVFGPYGSRLNRRLKMKGLQLRSDGELHTVEIFGPPGIHEWMKSFELLTTALVGFEAVSLGALLDYQGHIQELHDEHGPTTWSLLYQANVRCRLELMERIRRSLSEEDEADQPWDAVFRIAIEDQKFWRREFEKPALLVLTKAGRLNELVDDDAKVSKPPIPDRGVKRESDRDVSRVRVPKAPRNVHSVVDGRYTQNRSGHPICREFQSGDCGSASPGGWCPRTPTHVHQCALCLSPAHGAEHPHPCHLVPRQTSATSRADRFGKGKGKGKKDGK